MTVIYRGWIIQIRPIGNRFQGFIYRPGSKIPEHDKNRFGSDEEQLIGVMKEQIDSLV